VSASVSNNGTLVYAQTDAPAMQQLTWLDRAGRHLGTLGEAAPYTSLALSPDERRVAVAVATGRQENVAIWIIDIARNIRSRLTLDGGSDVSPVWSPDGTHIAFQASRSGKPVSLHQTLLNGTGAEESLLDGPGNFTMSPSDWSADGRFIAYMTRGSDIWVLPLFGDRKPFPLAQTPSVETKAMFSPDGHWIAYTSDEGGQPDVYVRPLPGAGGKSQVSRDGGSDPAW
jgi:Tol biopolymer transport system component